MDKLPIHHLAWLLPQFLRVALEGLLGVRADVGPQIIILGKTYSYSVFLYHAYSRNKRQRTSMQQLLDYLAIIAFALIYFTTKDIFLATGVLMGGVTLQLIAYKLLGKTIGNELKITFWVSIVLGGMTLLFRDEAFIQWKPSIVSWALALALLGAHRIGKIFLLQKILGHAITLPDEKWRVLTYGWALAFTLSGLLNLYVVDNYSMDVWVTFKLFGQMGINLFYVILMVVYLITTGALSEAEEIEEKDSARSENAHQAHSGEDKISGSSRR
jgi:intracellular septation protein